MPGGGIAGPGEGAFYRSFAPLSRCPALQAVLTYISCISPDCQGARASLHYPGPFVFPLLCWLQSFDYVFPGLFVICLLVHSSSLYILALKLHHRCNKHFSQSAAYPVALFMVILLKTFPFWGCQISVPFLLWPPKMPSPTQSIKNREING